MVRYADDFVVLCRNRDAAREAMKRVSWVLTHRLGLELHPEKTRLVNVGREQGSFDFLGCTLRKKRSILRSPRLTFLQRWPAAKAMKKIRARIRDLTDRRSYGAKDVKVVIERLTPVLRGWGNYFRSGNADEKFNQVDHYVHERLCGWLRKHGGQRSSFRRDRWPHDRFFAMGLHQLRTSVRYPAQATPERPSVSRVREIRTHGLKGRSCS
jgi:hypothetical protein